MTGFNNPNQIIRPLSSMVEGEILAMWSAGRDTLDIARALSIPESQVANELPRILERRRQDEAWEQHRSDHQERLAHFGLKPLSAARPEWAQPKNGGHLPS